MSSKYDATVLRDTREKEGYGWVFDPTPKRPGRLCIIGMESGKLDYGDYSLKEHPKLICIERKANMPELFLNLIDKSAKDRFYREMEGLKKTYQMSFILIESVLMNDSLTMGIPQMYKGPPGSRIIGELTEIQMMFNIPYMFVGNAGIRIAKILFEKAVKFKC